MKFSLIPFLLIDFPKYMHVDRGPNEYEQLELFSTYSNKRKLRREVLDSSLSRIFPVVILDGNKLLWMCRIAKCLSFIIIAPLFLGHICFEMVTVVLFIRQDD